MPPLERPRRATAGLITLDRRLEAPTPDTGLATSREGAVIQPIAEGITNKSACARLAVSLKTIEAHRAAAMRKLGLHTTADLVRYALRKRMIDV